MKLPAFCLCSVLLCGVGRGEDKTPSPSPAPTPPQSANEGWVVFDQAGFSIESPIPVEEKKQSTPQADLDKAGVLSVHQFIGQKRQLMIAIFVSDFSAVPEITLKDRMAVTLSKLQKPGMTITKESQSSVTLPGGKGEIARVKMVFGEKGSQTGYTDALLAQSGKKIAQLMIGSSEGSQIPAEILRTAKFTAPAEVEGPISSEPAVMPPDLPAKELELHCAKMRMELASLQKELQSRREKINAQDTKAVAEFNSATQESSKAIATLAAMEKRLAEMKSGKSVAAAKPAGLPLYQPALHFVGGITEKNGTGFFASAPSGKLLAVSSSQLLDPQGPSVEYVEYIDPTTFSPMARMDMSWGTPGDSKAHRANDFWVMSAPALTNVTALEFDYRQNPEKMEPLWFPDKQPLMQDGVKWVDGVVAAIKNDAIGIKLNEPLQVKNQIGTPILSAWTGKVIGIFSSYQVDKNMIVITPSRLMIEQATIGKPLVPLKTVTGKQKSP